MPESSCRERAGPLALNIIERSAVVKTILLAIGILACFQPSPGTTGVTITSAEAVVLSSLTPEEQAVFLGSVEDPPAEKLNGVNEDWEGKHYVAGDEWRLDVVEPHIRNLGGGYVGVGADQAYLLIGWSRPELSWLIDYDPVVNRVHHVHQVFLRVAETPAEFIALWDKENRTASQALLAKHLVKRKDRKDILRVHRWFCARVHRRLRRLVHTLEVPSYLNDQSQYDVVRAHVLSGRVRIMSANLLVEGAIREIGKSARTLGVPIRTVYLSNAEEYWRYKKIFRDNIRGLPSDETSRIIRTQSTYWINKDSLYNSQSLQDFQAYLGLPWVRRVYQIVPRKFIEGGDPYYVPVQSTAEEAGDMKKGAGS